MPDEPDPLATTARWATELHRARRARMGRDEWRQIGPTLITLRDAGVSWRLIEAETGISRTTAARLVARERRSNASGSSPSTNGS